MEDLKEQSHSSCCFCIEDSEFFWKDLNAITAAAVLKTLPPGSFLVRPSQHPSYKYTLSQKLDGNINHIRICRDKDGRYLLDASISKPECQVTHFSCVTKMINCWRRVYRNKMDQTLNNPARNEDQESKVTYVNQEDDKVCFYDDEAAERSFLKFCSSLVRHKN